MSTVSWGIDFGSRLTKVVQARRDGQRVVIERVLLVEHGHDLGEALQKAAITVREGTVGLGSKDCMLRIVKVPQAPPKRIELIMDFEINELSKRSPEPMCGAYHISGAVEEMSDQLLATIALVRERTTKQIYQNLREAKAGCNAFLPTSFALYNTFMSLKNYDPTGIHLLCDIGEQSTTITVVRNGSFLFGRTMPIGTNEFVKSLASALSVSQSRAEEILLREGVIKPKNWRDDRQKRISDSLSGVVDRIVLGIRSVLNTIQHQLRLKRIKLAKVLLFGGGSRLPGLPEAIGRFLKTEAEVVQLIPPPSNLYPETDPRPGLYEQLPAKDARLLSPTGSELAVAVGLALSNLGTPFLRLDLLPPALHKKIEFRQRYVWLIAAAVLLLLFIILTGLAVGKERGTAKERNSILKRRNEELETRRSALNAKRKKLSEVTKTLEKLQELPAVNKGIIKLLSDLRSPKVLPDTVSLQSIEFDRGERTEEEEKETLSISGTVQSEVGTELEIVRRFASTLESLPYIDTAEIDPEVTKRGKGRFRFRISVRFTEEKR